MECKISSMADLVQDTHASKDRAVILYRKAAGFATEAESCSAFVSTVARSAGRIEVVSQKPADEKEGIEVTTLECFVIIGANINTTANFVLTLLETQYRSLGTACCQERWTNV